MLGLGETDGEVYKTMDDLVDHGLDILRQRIEVALDRGTETARAPLASDDRRPIRAPRVCGRARFGSRRPEGSGLPRVARADGEPPLDPAVLVAWLREDANSPAERTDTACRGGARTRLSAAVLGHAQPAGILAGTHRG